MITEMAAMTATIQSLALSVNSVPGSQGRHWQTVGAHNTKTRTIGCPKTLEKYRLAISNNYVAYRSKRKSHVTPGRKF